MPISLSLLRLSLTSGVGPILGRRLLTSFSSPEAIFRAAPADLERVHGIGPNKSRRIHTALRESEAALETEVSLAQKLGIRLLALGAPDYPPLLAECPDAPLILYIKTNPTTPLPWGEGAFGVGIVGSRHCTPYGIEQAERFSAWLAQSGLIIVSGGARGIDSAAHRAALRVNGTTIAVLGCGLANCYPPENAELFDQIAASGGAVVSELPLQTQPTADNFPARNRIIVGLSLGILVIEAPRGSGALITARIALDEYNREIIAIPGRIDSPASEGSNELLKKGEAALATTPSDVLDMLESAARHQHNGTHEARFAPLFPTSREAEITAASEPALFEKSAPPAPKPTTHNLSPSQKLLIEALTQPASINELIRLTGMEPGTLQADATMLEIRKIIVRDGSKLALRKPNG